MKGIRKIRKQRKLSLKEVASYLDMPRMVYLYNEIVGIDNLHYDIYLDLMDLLGIKKQL